MARCLRWAPEHLTARMEWTGVPIDTAMLARLRAGWGGIKGRLITEVDSGYGVYEGSTFKATCRPRDSCTAS